MVKVKIFILFLFLGLNVFGYQKQIPSGFHYEKDQNNRDFLVKDKPLTTIGNKPFSMKNYLEERSIKTGINLSSTSKKQDFFLINKILLPVDEEKTDDRKVEYFGVFGFISIVTSIMLMLIGLSHDIDAVFLPRLSIVLFFLSLILSIIGLYKKESDYKYRGFGMIALLLIYLIVSIVVFLTLYFLSQIGE